MGYTPAQPAVAPTSSLSRPNSEGRKAEDGTAGYFTKAEYQKRILLGTGRHVTHGAAPRRGKHYLGRSARQE